MIEGWHLLPWTGQYLIAAIVITSVSFYILKKNPKSWTSRYFFIFGIFIAIWQITNFLSKNAPNEEMAANFHGIVIFSGLLGSGFLLASMMNIPKERWYYVIIVLPTVPFALAGLLLQPFFMTWNEMYGWIYTFTENFLILTMIIAVVYTASIGVISFATAHKYPSLKKKVYTILFSWVIVNMLGIFITTMMLELNIIIPRVGGIVNFTSFIIIAYVINQPMGEIKVDTSSELSNIFFELITNLYNSIPGEELGERIVRFQRYIEVLGLKDVVTMKDRDMFILNVGDLNQNELKKTTEKILKGLKNKNVEQGVNRSTAKLINYTYKILKNTDAKLAQRWLDEIIFDHGAYLYHQGTLDIFYDKEIPLVISKYTPGRAYLITSKKPLDRYKEISELMVWGYRLLSITKYEIDSLNIREGERCSIFSIFEDDEDGKIVELIDLKKRVSDITSISDQLVIFIDCLDTLVMVYGSSRVYNFLEDLIRDLTDHDNIFIAAVNSNLIQKEMLKDIGDLFSEVWDR